LYFTLQQWNFHSLDRTKRLTLFERYLHNFEITPLLFNLFTFQINAQVFELNLEKQTNNKIKSISSGSLSLFFTTVITTKGEKFKGRLRILDYKNIIVKNDTLEVSNIERIKVKPILPMIFGGVIATLGIGFSVTVSSLIFLTLLPQINLKLILLNPYTLIGLGVASVGILTVFINRTYKKSVWAITVSEH